VGNKTEQYIAYKKPRVIRGAIKHTQLGTHF